MKTDKNICVVVKAPWFLRGEHRKTISMDGDFVSQVQVGDEIGCHLLLRTFVPFDMAGSRLDNMAKIELHHSAKQTMEADSNVSYTEALESTYVDWVSRRTGQVTKRKWCLNLGNGESFLEITIQAEDY